MDSQNFTHHFLIAMPAMTDPEFSGTLTYLCEHNESGAIGLVVNRPSKTSLSSLLHEIDIPLADLRLGEQPVLHGGPVFKDRGFVLHTPEGEWTSTLSVAEGVAMTTSKDILEATGAGNGPPKMLVTMGYAGWGAGQLEQEIAANAWLTVKAEPHILFEVPAAQKFDAAVSLLGIARAQLASFAGRA